MPAAPNAWGTTYSNLKSDGSANDANVCLSQIETDTTNNVTNFQCYGLLADSNEQSFLKRIAVGTTISYTAGYSSRNNSGATRQALTPMTAPLTYTVVDGAMALAASTAAVAATLYANSY